jgi:hypothetical protein
MSGRPGGYLPIGIGLKNNHGRCQTPLSRPELGKIMTEDGRTWLLSQTSMSKMTAMGMKIDTLPGTQ